MRMWLVDPATMCRKHLLGEHVEMHMYIGSLAKGVKATGYLDGNLLEPAVLQERHDALATEMTRRNYIHKSPIDQVKLQTGLRHLSNFERATVIDKEAARVELHRRCSECSSLHAAFLGVESRTATR